MAVFCRHTSPVEAHALGLFDYQSGLTTSSLRCKVALVFRMYFYGRQNHRLPTVYACRVRDCKSMSFTNSTWESCIRMQVSDLFDWMIGYGTPFALEQVPWNYTDSRTLAALAFNGPRRIERGLEMDYGVWTSNKDRHLKGTREHQSRKEEASTESIGHRVFDWLQPPLKIKEVLLNLQRDFC